MPDPMNSTTMLARSGHTDPGGKMTSRLDVPCSDELNDAFITISTLRSRPKAECIRESLEQDAWGALAIAQRRMGNHVATGHSDCHIGMEEALMALATLHGISVQEYKDAVLERHAFGRLVMAVRMTRSVAKSHPTNSRGIL